MPAVVDHGATPGRPQGTPVPQSRHASAIDRNRCPLPTRTAVRFGSEPLSALDRNQCPFSIGLRTKRPHRSLPGPATPAAAYQLRPKAGPGDRTADTHWRVRHDRVDKAGRVTLRHDGRLHHIGVGYEHTQTRVVMLIADLHVRVVDAATGELLRDLVLDPTRGYQPLGRKPGPRPRKPQHPEPQ